MKNYVILFPTRLAGSLGDQAMYHVLFSQLEAKGLCSHYPDFGETYNYKGAASFRGYLFKGHESFLTKTLNQLTVLLKYTILLLRRDSILLVIGADALDAPKFFGHWVIKIAIFFGRKITVLGFSFRENVSPKVQSLIRSSPDSTLYYLRDPLSFKRFQEIRAQGSHSVADMAYLLEPKPVTDSGLREFISRYSGEYIIVCPALRGPFSKEQNLSSFIDILGPDTTRPILIFNHDHRENNFDLCKALKQKLSRENVFCQDYIDSREFRFAVKNSFCLISMLMHPAIAALACEKPVLALDYANKTKGAFSIFGLENWAFSSPDDFECKYPQFIKNIDLIRQTISEKLPATKELSLRNFETL